MSVRRSAVDRDGPPVIMASGPWIARVTTSLGICAIQAVMQPDLLGALSAGDREGPPVTAEPAPPPARSPGDEPGRPQLGGRHRAYGDKPPVFRVTDQVSDWLQHRLAAVTLRSH